MGTSSPLCLNFVKIFKQYNISEVLPLTSAMAKKHLKAAAARARAARWHAPSAKSASTSPHDSATELAESSLGTGDSSFTDNTFCNFSDQGSESECGYSRGVNMDLSDSDEDSSDWVDSEAESLSELEGDELELNLEELRKETEALVGPEVNWKIMEKKTLKEWVNAEKNRALGYTGLSSRTRQRHEKDARDRAAFRRVAQTS